MGVTILISGGNQLIPIDGLPDANMSIQTTTDANYVGTTATVEIEGTNDGTNFRPVSGFEGATLISTLTTASATAILTTNRALYKQYRINFLVGNATAGAVTVTTFTVR